MAPAKLTALLQEGIAHQRAGRFSEAEKTYIRARVAMPTNYDAWFLSGVVTALQHRHEEAAALFERALKMNPRSAKCALRLAHALKVQGRHAQARQAAQRAVGLDAASPDAHFLLGELAAGLEGFAAAVPHFRRVTELQPAAADAWANLGVAQAQSHQVAAALDSFQRALTLEPANAQALTGRALALQLLQRVDEAVAAYGEVLARHPRNHEARSARLLALHYLDGVSRERLHAEHLAFGQAVEAVEPRLPPVGVADQPARRLRVAFLSPDLRAHSVAYFLEPLLAHLDASQFEVHLYHDHAQVDAMSARLRALAAGWRNFAGCTSAQVEKTIRADAPDVLIDLAGHTGFNRLPLLARRLAPVQITYLGYPDTTGLAAMDYRFTDELADPVGSADRFHTEELVRFAPTAWTYAPPVDAPDPRAGARAAGEPVTFGCFNNFAKVSDGTVALWARLLNAVPAARLLLKAAGLEEPAQQARVRARFAVHGVAPERIELLGRTPGLAAHLGHYHRVDVALDTFPYHGTTTTCEALWMGVPVVTLEGDRHMSRVGVSLLHAIGHPEWVAKDAEDFVRIASELANPAAPAARGLALREHMRISPLLDHAGQAQWFGEALRACWADACAGGSPRRGSPVNVSANLVGV